MKVRPTVIVGLPYLEQAEVVDELRDAGFGVVEAGAMARLAKSVAGAPGAAVLVLDASEAPRTTVDAVARARASGANVAVLFVIDAGSFDAVESAGIDPVDEMVLRPYTADSVRWRVEAMVIRSGVEPGRVDPELSPVGHRGKTSGNPIIAVFNPKGGVGKTTISTNLAAALQIRNGRRVLLIDADTVTGHVAMSLGLPPGRGIADSWEDDAGGDPGESILDMAVVHGSGLRVAALTTSPLALPHLDPARVTDALLEARAGVDVVVVDLHPSYGEVNLAVFAIADRILVPVTPDLPAMRAAIQLTQVATELGVLDRLSLVVNRANSGVSIGDIEKATSLPLLATVRSGGMLFVRAANLGKTVIEQFPREKVTADFERLADQLLELVGAPAEAHVDAAHGTVFGNLLGRRAIATS
jgi:pilus assembly protein CpaE